MSKNHHHHSWIHKTAFVLLLIGGLELGLMGLFDWNLIGTIFEAVPVLARIIYVLVGLAAVYRFVYWVKFRASGHKRG